MRIFRHLLMLIGAAGFGVSSLPQDAQAERPAFTEEELACKRALMANTVEALEDFLRKYRRGNSTCHALALNALGDAGGREGGGGRGNNGYNR